jgi:AraC-like DNA-binding protein
MTPAAFFQEAAIRRLLARAAEAGACPLSLHFTENNREGPKILSWGGCAACRHVGLLDGGARACRQSRTSAAVMALRQRRPVSFICHMGFACAAVQGLHDEGYVLTFGPWCPQEERRSLEFDAINGLEALTGHKHGSFPVSLEDIRIAPSTTLPAIAEWTREALNTAWQREAMAAAEKDAPETASSVPAEQVARAAREKPESASRSAAAALAIAIAADNPSQIRMLLRTALEEVYTHPRVRIGVRRGRMTACAAAAMEALEQAGHRTGPAWKAFPDFLAAVQHARNDAELINAGADLLYTVRGTPARETGKTAAPAWEELNQLLLGHLASGITLQEAAERLEESPSAISHRLKRNFGMNFSEYFGSLRVDKAKELFRNTRLPVHEVARRVGIDDSSNFGRLFRKIAGMAPGAYKAQYGRKK